MTNIAPAIQADHSLETRNAVLALDLGTKTVMALF